MITKERLQELIDEGAIIYYKDATPIHLLREDYFVEDCGTLEKSSIKNTMLFVDGFENTDRLYDLKDLYEHKADAEWDLEFGNVEKRIKFVKPKPFREIENEKDYVYDAHGFLMYKYSGTISVYEEDNSYDGGSIIFEKPFNEENYKEACRLIKKLFMGEE